MKHALEPIAAEPHETMGDAHVPRRLSNLLGVGADRHVYLSTAEAAELIPGSLTRGGVIKWCRRHQVPLRKPDGGRTYAIKKSDLDWALRVR